MYFVSSGDPKVLSSLCYTLNSQYCQVDKQRGQFLYVPTNNNEINYQIAISLEIYQISCILEFEGRADRSI